jgi:hypothetical protein
MRYIAGVLCLVFLAGCLHHENEAMKPPKDAITVSELLAQAEKWDGKIVRVYGYYYDHAPSAVLFPSKKVFEKKQAGNGLWIGPDCAGSLAEKTHRESETYVIIEGEFRNQPLGTFGEFPAQVGCISRFEIQ